MEFDFKQQPGLVNWGYNYVNTGTPLVSIITPYFNGGKYIRQTCRCVLNQTFPYFEWLIIDDGSTDETDLRILDEISHMDPRIRVFHKENGGISTARNYGIRQARTDLVLPLDADDLLEPTFVEYCWWMLLKNPKAAWAYTDSVGFQGEEYLWNKRFDPVAIKKNNLLTATALIRKEALQNIGLYYEGEKHFNEDWHAWLKILANGGYPVQSGGEYLFWYRRSNNGVLSKVRTDKQIVHRNRRLINDAARCVGKTAEPVYYPHTAVCNWEHPTLSSWSRCVYAEKKKEHVLFLFPHLEMGGADKFNLELLERLDKNRYDCSVITTVRAQNIWQQAFRKVTPNVFNLPNFVEPKDYAEFITYYLKSRRVDVLFVSNSFLGYYLLPWLRENFPDLVIVDYVHMEERYWRNGGYARASAVVGMSIEKTYVCNHATHDTMINRYGRPKDSVQTVHIGVDERHFSREKTPSGILYKEAGIDLSRSIVLFICRLDPQKRPFLMLRIAERLLRRIPDVAFVVVGDGPQEAELRQAVRKEGLGSTVYFLGSKQDVRPYYRDAAVTLICSLKEGLSLTAYESCAMGVPVVSADVGGQKDLITPDIGVLVRCRQVEAVDWDDRCFSEEEIEDYVDALSVILNDNVSRQQMAENSRRKIEEAFSVEQTVRFFEEEFGRLIANESLREDRHSVCNTLRACSPMSAELFTAQMRAQNTEFFVEQERKKHLVVKVWSVLRKEGVCGLFKRVVSKFFKR